MAVIIFNQTFWTFVQKISGEIKSQRHINFIYPHKVQSLIKSVK